MLLATILFNVYIMRVPTAEFHPQIGVSLSYFSHSDHPLHFSFLVLFPTSDSVEHAIDLASSLLRLSHEVHECVGSLYINLLFYLLPGVVPPKSVRLTAVHTLI